MSNHLGAIVTKLFQTRDELSFRNIRSGFLPVLLVFPLAVIMGNLRYYDHGFAFIGFGSSQLMFFLLGLGQLTLVFTPKRLIIPVLRLAAIASAVLLPFLIFLPIGLDQYALYMVFKYFNGLCAACAFYLFCFVLNNVERLAGLAIIQLYYGLYYATRISFPALHAAGETWGGLFIITLFLIMIFFCRTKQWSLKKLEINTGSDGRRSGVPFVIGLGVVHYMIMCVSNYIDWTEQSISSFAFGLGTLLSIGLIIIIQLLNGRNALHIWLMFLVLTLFGHAALLYNTPAGIFSGSFAYGIGDSLGYIIFCYVCAGSIKLSKSLRMFRLYCLVYFIEYFIISGLFSFYFNYFDGPDKVLAFGIVLVLVCLCLLFMPLIQKQLFNADWTDGLYLRDMEEYSRPLAETEKINDKNQLNLTPREKEIFTMLLDGKAPKEIGFTLKVSYHTICFHQKNLYRKLGIQSRAELFARYKE
ncbi:MAG: helix-turn-helix transcriptional regulator [Treponema sp.]|nr:helix-turn-helix transcriptional regulator [Treponema sp.]